MGEEKKVARAKEEIAPALRVVCDTNVAVSALVFRAGRLAWLREAWAAGKVIPVVSKETVTELVRVLGYPKLRLNAEETKNLLALYLEHAETVGEVKTSARVPVCRDEDDRVFLRLAYAARVDALVTGDADLLDVAASSKIPILAPDDFRRRL